MVVSAFGRYSGSHLNPALSFGKFLSGKLDCVAFLGYFLAQVIGVFSASLINEFVLGNDGPGQFHAAVFDSEDNDAIKSMCACILASFCYVYRKLDIL